MTLNVPIMDPNPNPKPMGSTLGENPGPSCKAQKSARVVNPQGFHMRPKAAFAELAGRFQSEVTITWEGRIVNGKSMWDLMLVAALPGSEVSIEAVGADATEAVDCLVKLIEEDHGDPT
jgi:phosphocarrier protein HPr